MPWRAEFAAFYQSLRSRFDQGATDLTPESLDGVLRAVRGKSVLDVACGTGGHLRYLKDWFEVTGLDIDPAMVAQARDNLPDVQLIEADMRAFIEVHGNSHAP